MSIDLVHDDVEKDLIKVRSPELSSKHTTPETKTTSNISNMNESMICKGLS